MTFDLLTDVETKPDGAASLLTDVLCKQEPLMSYQIWNSERNSAKGIRATVKIHPTGQEKKNGMRYRMLRGPWEKSDSESRDYYNSCEKLRRRLNALQAQFLDA